MFSSILAFEFDLNLKSFYFGIKFILGSFLTFWGPNGAGRVQKLFRVLLM